MFMAKTVLLSFDYELFFGALCGSVDECLIIPTQKILDALKKAGGRAVFFVDYLMLKRMHGECEETRSTAEKIEEQLRKIVRSGSRIELHLHPHWVDAKYRGGGQWDFSNYSHYRLHSLPKEDVVKMFKEGAEYLNRIACDVVPNYRVRAFRAGGWAVQPFSHLIEGFSASGIDIDSSVCKGCVLNGINYCMDFSGLPNADIYSFSNDILKPDDGGTFTEVQISSYMFNPLTYLLDGVYRKLNRLKYQHHVEGTYMTSGEKVVWKPMPLVKRMFRRALFGLDTTSKIAFFLHSICSWRKFTVVMGHPKDMNELMLENIAFLGRFARFVTYEDVA